ncbi:class I SAM-dependent DNA methyltransferase [Cyanobacterium aponinum]|uniref:site-specific DNA-methyltransferase (adenine-specific) n=1 Tax=Cyanobacterium aponinum (strain PCC 10605) TaxID=755178 RepID=K9Z4A6_CYAAP|nr:Eco57I restriction-modification methylase domain-containing protein [Cyanobacterium aponinum]AFZ54026.1 putative type IIS restriction/modification enzyme [Cyanobacterium aponinum PCC 10605]
MKTILHSLNKAFLKVKPSRQEINQFKQNLQELYTQINTNLSETEEYHKNNLANFFKQTYYHPNYYINTKESHDLVIYNGKNAKSSVGVIIETKSPTNSQEMINEQKFNSKSLQQLLFYYLQERVINKNLELKHLIITNSLDFYVFPATLFEKLFYQDKKLIKLFDDFNNKLLSSSNRNFFYQEIAKTTINKVENELKDNCIHFTLNNFYKKEDEKELIILYKFFSPQHLLKQPFANDSNSLDQGFYSELLHIIGLAEVKQGSKKIIQRLPENQRHSASLLENTINQLDISEKVHYLQNPEEYGENYQQRLFNIALELVITWVNRILFLKLLEAQLIRYNSPLTPLLPSPPTPLPKARRDFSNDELRGFNFLNSKIITNFHELECLFFQVLAKQNHERKADIQAKFNHIPYLNSSLFEVTVIERQTIGISSLNYQIELDLYSHTVLKDSQGKPLTQPQKTLDYLFNFLSAYDFSSEGSLEIQEDNKTLINASVLGLIFEKINGYQDGSYFTPGFITMYMCRETIRRAIVNKFNQVKGWNCQNIDDLYEKIEDKQEANQIINSIKICDPAVGSGHFLVSALNEIIALKSELNILLDRQGKTIKKTDYFVTVENDELIVTDEDNKPFAYNPKNRESRRIQEALFHEKQVIIENCLFGVDININSVKICRLRLWIELLKNAYYIIPDNGVLSSSLTPLSQENLPSPLAPLPQERGIRGGGFSFFPLQTLPNIDINIKCGNSLISRFDLKDSISSPKVKRQIAEYKEAVKAYRNPESKQEKQRVERVINEIKASLSSEITGVDAISTRLRQLEGELNGLVNQTSLFAETAKEKKAREKKQKQLEKEINKLRLEREDKRDNRIYQNGFEWRFEFPEILDDNGDFLGFDIIIGNPPYIRQEEFSALKPILKSKYQIYHSIADLLTYFVELGFNLLKVNGVFQFIISNKFTRANYGQKMRQFLLDNTALTHFIDFSGLSVFEEATVDACIVGFVKNKINNHHFLYGNFASYHLNINNFRQCLAEVKRDFLQSNLTIDSWSFESSEVLRIKRKVESQGTPLKNWDITINYGIKTGYNEAFIIDGKTRENLINQDSKSAEIMKPLLRGRDIQKYYPNFQDLWLIYIPWHFPLHKDNSIKGVSTISENQFKNEYSAIYNHLLQFKDKLSQRNKSETGIRYEWYALQRFASNYWEDFEKPKIMYPEFSSRSSFCWDNNKFYTLDTCWILNGGNYYLLGLLNSSLIWFYLKTIVSVLGSQAFRMKKIYLEELPIKKISEREEKTFMEIVEKILEKKKENPEADTEKLERKIDEMVYKLYGLTAEEIAIVEGGL